MRARAAFFTFCILVCVAGIAFAQSSPVVDVQKQLSALGYDPGPIDGALGPKTRKAVEAFQRASNLPPTSELTPETLGKLNAACVRR